ncbi:glycosyltransferase [Algoriphagus resistens]|uniref:glycosyltransferase n=1 Tax=Algoriphagus resistens TaxID=1750590 RepID=UPI000716A5AA|nr:glycosyltransferase [Algoriphagus resistens]
MDSFPGISIIICTHNGSARLTPTLEAISKLNAEFPWEIVVINNASTDETATVVKKFFTSHSSKKLKWKLVEEKTPGLVYAKFKGIAECLYPYLLFCDDDNWLFPDYLVNAADILSKNNQIGALGGKGIAVFEGEKPNWFEKYYSTFAVGSQINHLGDNSARLGYVYGAGAIFKTNILKEIIDSGFQLALTGRKGDILISGEDVELCYLVQIKGYELHYSERLAFYHWIPRKRTDWEYFLKVKEGITHSSAFLFSYQYFYMNKNRGVIAFTRALYWKLLVAYLIYHKNKVRPTRGIINFDLAIRILKARKHSLKKDFYLAITHFKQLKEFY